MASSIYNQLNNSSGIFPNQQNLINQFNEFRKNFQGNPQQMDQQLLQNGSMSQQQYNQLRQMALQFRQLLGGS